MWLSWLCLILVLLCPIASIIAYIISTRGYTIKFDPPEKIIIGSDSEVRVKGKPKKILIGSTYKMFLTITDMMSGEKKDFLIKGSGDIDVHLSVNTEHCGCFSYQITKLKIYDLFGLFSLGMKNIKEAEVVVWPCRIIAPFRDRSQKSKKLTKTNNPAAEIYEVKEYAYGDPLKSIHWKASAKKDMLLVKESYEERKDHNVIVIPLTSDRDMVDHKLGESLFVSNQLLNHDTSHKISVINSGNESEYTIKNYRDLDIVILNILRTALPKEEPV